MRCWAWAFIVAGCVEPASQQPTKFAERDLAGFFQPPDSDGGGADLATQGLKLDLSLTGTPDLAGAPDLASRPDLATAPDLAQPLINEPPIYVHTARTLYRLDPNTYDLTLIGDFNVGVDITDIAEDVAGNLIAISFTSIYTVDPATGQATAGWLDAFQDMNALTYLSDGRLLSSDLSGNVFEIVLGPHPWSWSTLGSYGSSQTTAGDLVSASNGTTWGLTKSGGAATDANNVLMIVNNVSGAGTPKGPTGFGKLWGTAYSNHRILAFSSTGEVVALSPSTGAGTLLRTYAGYSFYGATSNPNVPN